MGAATATYLAWRATAQPVYLDAHSTQHPLGAETASKPGALAAAAVDHTDAPPARKAKPKTSTSSERPSDPTSSASATQAESESEEAEGESSGGAFNPVTGEINWDCPCLGGMAHGPCGPEFREAFSCFVYSDGEPKGIECVEKFKGMQDCFRRHPEVYAEEIMDDDEDEAPARAQGDAPTAVEEQGGLALGTGTPAQSA
jgi:intermembrane space import and assembly protein 40